MLEMEEEGAENVDEAAGSLAPPTAMTPSREGGSRTTGACMGTHVRGGSCPFPLPILPELSVDWKKDLLPGQRRRLLLIMVSLVASVMSARCARHLLVKGVEICVSSGATNLPVGLSTPS